MYNRSRTDDAYRLGYTKKHEEETDTKALAIIVVLLVA